jgi:uncharacterized Fe-S cluster-containing protein
MAQKSKRQDWVIGIACAENDGVCMYLCKNMTMTEVKKILVQLVKQDKNNDADKFEYGSTNIKDIVETYARINNERCLYGLEANACFSSYHIDYTAVPLASMHELYYV